MIPAFPTAQVVQQLQNELPAEDANGTIGTALKGFLTTIPNLAINGYATFNFNKEQKSLDNLANIINSNTEVTKETIDSAFDYQKKNCTFFDKIWDKCSGCPPTTDLQDKLRQDKIENLEKLRKEYLDGIKKVKQELADGVLQSCVVSTCIIIVQESIRLILIWNHINDARNCIVDNENRRKIDTNLNRIRGSIGDLQNLQKEFAELSDSSHKEDLLDQIEDEQNDLREIIIETQHLIASVKIEINGKKERLIGDDQSLTISIFGNVTQLAVNSLQFVSGAGAGSLFWKGLAGAALATHAGITGFAVYTKIVTQEAIKECRAAFQQLVQLDGELVLLQRRCNEIRRWLRNVTRQTSMN